MTEELGEMAKGILAGLDEAVAHVKGEPNKVRTTVGKLADEPHEQLRRLDELTARPVDAKLGASGTLDDSRETNYRDRH